MAWRIELTASAARQIGKLDRREAKRITSFLRQRLATLDDPRSAGKALTSPQGTYSCRRLPLCLLVIEVGNRRELYR